MVLEKQSITLGFIPLTDSAPLVIAKERGFFTRWGLQVTLEKQPCWATLQHALLCGSLDAAHMLAPMPLACSLGLNCEPTTVIVPLVLSLNGNGITLSQALHAEILAANQLSRIHLPMAAYLLHKVIEKRKARGEPKLVFAHVHDYSSHHYQLRDWLNSANIKEHEVKLVSSRAADMTKQLQQGNLDGICVGGPWNAQAVRCGTGLTALTSFDIWQDSPEKVLAVLGEFNTLHPNTVVALCGALQQACKWLETIPNRFEAARILSQPEYLDTRLDVIAPSLLGSCLTEKGRSPRSIPSYHQFSVNRGSSINQPELIRAQWLLKHMDKAGQLDALEIPPGFVSRVFRPDIYQKMRPLLDEYRERRDNERECHFNGAGLHRIES